MIFNYLLIAFHVISCLVLIVVILLQAGKGGGLSQMFGSSTQSIFGTQATTFMARLTAFCAIAYLATSLGLTMYSNVRSRSLMQKQLLDKYNMPPIERPATIPEPISQNAGSETTK